MCISLLSFPPLHLCPTFVINTSLKLYLEKPVVRPQNATYNVHISKTLVELICLLKPSVNQQRSLNEQKWE